jgi:hypothetical protein
MSEISNLDLVRIKTQARDELREEHFREAVEKEKQRLRTARPWWTKFFPFIIKIERVKS